MTPFSVTIPIPSLVYWREANDHLGSPAHAVVGRAISEAALAEV
jgi:hypothetical protein